MSKPILPALLTKYDSIYKEWSVVDRQLVDRLTYIFRQVGQHCGFTFRDWNVYGAPYNEYGDVRSVVEKYVIDTSRVHFDNIEFHVGYDNRIFIKNRIVNVNHNLPKQWLFENFEEELALGSETFKMKTKMIAAQARAKLSKKELQALGIK